MSSLSFIGGFRAHGFCPVSVRAIEDRTTGVVEVEYHKNHLGHRSDFDFQEMTFQNDDGINENFTLAWCKEQQWLVEMLKVKLPVLEILNRIKLNPPDGFVKLNNVTKRVLTRIGNQLGCSSVSTQLRKSVKNRRRKPKVKTVVDDDGTVREEKTEYSKTVESHIVLVVGGEEIYASKEVLLKSNVLSAMIDMSSESEENQCDRVEVPDVEYSVMHELICGLYGCKLIFKESNGVELAKKLVRASYIYDVDSVRSECEQFLIDKIDSNNCVELTSMAGDFQCSDLYTAAMEVIAKNIGDIPTQDLETFSYAIPLLLLVQQQIKSGTVKEVLPDETIEETPIDECITTEKPIVGYRSFGIQTDTEELSSRPKPDVFKMPAKPPPTLVTVMSRMSNRLKLLPREDTGTKVIQYPYFQNQRVISKPPLSVTLSPVGYPNLKVVKHVKRHDDLAKDENYWPRGSNFTAYEYKRKSCSNQRAETVWNWN